MIYKIVQKKNIRINVHNKSRNSEWYAVSGTNELTRESVFYADIPYFSENAREFTFQIGEIVDVISRLGPIYNEIKKIR